MRTNLLLITASTVLTAVAMNAQPQPVYYQTVACIKVTPGKFTEFHQFVNDTSKKMAEQRAKAGEIVSWGLLRSVMPAGDEARCDFSIFTTYEGAPPAPRDAAALGTALEKAGVKMTAAQYLAKRDSLGHLVASEMWRPRARIGQPEKGQYLFVNYMKVHEAAAYYKFEMEVWKPLAEEFIKAGLQSGWMFSTRLLPGGTDVKYIAKSADIYPTWEAAFKAHPAAEYFKKAHPDMDYQQTMAGMTKLRDLAERDLYRIEERVARKESPSATDNR